MALVAAGVPLCWGLWLSVRFPEPLESLVSIGVLVAAPAYAIAGVASAGTAVALACRRQWRALPPCLVLPVAIAALVLVPGARASVVLAADRIHLAALAVRYERAVAAVPRTDRPRFVWFLWKEVAGTLGPDTNVILVFDESDEWALPEAERSDAWNDRAAIAFANTLHSWMAPPMPDEANHLFGHWYVVRIIY